MQEKDFMINGNLSTSTFMANKEFNDIIEKMLNNYMPLSPNVTAVKNDGKAYFEHNYSGFNGKSNP